MKTSTLRRPKMSRERVLALDEILPNNSTHYDSSPGVYVRSDQDRELDVLWQGFKVNHREERSSGFYLTVGFIAGVICAIIMTLIINIGSPTKDNASDLNLWKKATTKPTVNIAPSTQADVAGSMKNTEYIVKNGDTLGAIAYKYYGVSNPAKIQKIQDAYILALFGDSITTDHISPAGNISVNSPAAKFLKERGIEKKDFNTYGARRGNDLIMARGTFANIRIINKMMKGETGPKTIHVPTGETLFIFDAAEKYQQEKHQLVIIGGKEYGSGSSRDWAAKGPFLQGVKAVIAQSFERIHRSNLIGMGILPLTFLPGETAETHGLTGQ